MKRIRSRVSLAAIALPLIALFCAVAPCAAEPAADQHFDVLQVGTRTYENVTVTTKAKDYVFIMHSGGLGNIKVADLSPEVREKLGYVVKKSSDASAAGAWAKQTISKLETPQVKAVEASLQQRFNAKGLTPEQVRSMLDPRLVVAVVGIFLISYIFYCYCSMLICQKTGNAPGVLVWLPLVQIIPMLRAARMSPLWFLALWVPVLNLVTHIVWSFRIVQARGKSGWVTLFLLLPLTNIFAYCYLAFSDKPERKTDRRIQLMTLETA